MRFRPSARCRGWLLGLVLTGLGSAVMADGPWSLQSSSDPLPLGHGAIRVKKVVTGPVKVRFELVFFDAAKCRLAVLAQGDRKNAGSMTGMLDGFPVVAACNGGYFSPDFEPAGLQISGGIRSGTFQKGVLWGGGVWIRDGVPGIFLEQEFVDGPGIQDMIQCWPVLVDGFRRFSGGGGEDGRARRTFVMTDGAGRWALGIVDRLGLVELTDLLVTPGIITEMAVSRALNLDGGPSTGLWYRDSSGGVHYYKEMWPVKNVLVIMPRP